jgi:hypothetical protein
MPSGPDPNPASLLPLQYCPQCGYPRTGLPSDSRCPECGEFHLPEEIVLYGWPYSRFGILGISPVYMLGICVGVFLLADATIGLIAFIACVLAVGGSNLLMPILMTLTYGVSGVGVILAAAWWRRRNLNRMARASAAGRPTLQLRLSPDGYAFRRGFGPAPCLHWIADMEIDLPLDRQIAHLRMARLSPVGVIDWSTVVDIAFQATPEQVVMIRSYLDKRRAASTPR